MTLPPGPSENALLQVWRYFRDPHEFFSRCVRQYGDTFTMRYPGNPPLVVFSHPAAVKEFFTAVPDGLRAGEANAILRNVVGEHSLFVLDGASHDHDRRALVRLLQTHASGATLGQIATHGVRELPRGDAFLANRCLEVISLDMILGALFQSSSDEVLKAMRAAVLRFSHLAVGQGGTFAAMLLPPRGARVLASLVPFSRIVRAQRDLRRVVHSEIARRRRQRHLRDDFLSSLMAIPDNLGTPPSDEHVCDQAITLILAGHETSAVTLAWAAHHLIEHDDIQDELRSELASHDAEGCVLLDAVLKETLRITPVVPVIPRRVTRTLPIGGYRLQAGVAVAVSPYLTHHHEDFWAQPSRFDPARFVGRRIDPYAFFPFGGGGRRCVGMVLSLSIMKIVLAEMLRQRAWHRAGERRAEAKRQGLLVAPFDGPRVVAPEV